MNSAVINPSRNPGKKQTCFSYSRALRYRVGSVILCSGAIVLCADLLQSL